MKYIYIDEKGPQETIRISFPYEDDNKIKLGNDKMHDYVGNVIMLSDNNKNLVESKYKDLEQKYKVLRRVKKYSSMDKELKGKHIFDKKLKYGVANIKKRELDFLSSLIDLLIENRVNNLLFSINKLALVVDHRLDSWILDLDKRRFIDSTWIFKYSLVKYLRNEASSTVIHSIFDENKSNQEIIFEIQHDLQNFIAKHKSINRMKLQVQNYKELLFIIKSAKHLISNPSSNFNEVTFNWEKVSYNLDLWITEMSERESIQTQSIELILDDGIPDQPFDHLIFKNILKNQDSSDHVGLRICDVLVVLIGKMISQLSKDVQYDKNNPEIRKLLPTDWFTLEKEQFELIKKMDSYLFPEESVYCLISDTYFDNSILLESYFKYISAYKTYSDFESYMNYHVENHFKFLHKLMTAKWEKARENEAIIRKLYGSTSNAIEYKVVKPI